MAPRKSSNGPASEVNQAAAAKRQKTLNGSNQPEQLKESPSAPTVEANENADTPQANSDHIEQANTGEDPVEDDPEGDPDWEKEVQEDERMFEERLREDGQERNSEAGERPEFHEQVSTEKLNKLEKLLNRTELYSQFLSEAIQEMDNQLVQEANSGGSTNENARAPRGSKQKKSRKSNQSQEKASPTKTLLPLLDGELREYQLKGVRWLISLYQNGMNGILADEMGLGKTVQTIGFLSHLRYQGVVGPFLILAPLSTLPNWQSEFQNWCSSFPTLLYHGSKEERQEMQKKYLKRKVDDKFPAILTSFEIFLRDKSALNKINYKYLVVDEGHRLKNFECKLIKQVRQVNTDNKLLLTGTPLQNNLSELWSLLNFLAPEVFSSLGEFQSWFSFSEHVGQDQRKVLEAQRMEGLVSKLHSIISPYLLRREKKEVESDLPRKKEIVLYAQLAEEQRRLTQAYLDQTIETVLQQQSQKGNGAPVTGLNNQLMQLRKVCNHPDLLLGEFDESLEFPPLAKLREQCGKLQLLERVLERLKKNGHKALLFSQMSRMLDILEYFLEQRGWRACRIDGSVKMEDRHEQINQFNKDPECFVFLLTTRAGGLGLNLMAADTVIIYDSDWNPHADFQAMDRCHRIGQSKPVHIYRMVTANTIEDKMLEKANDKLMLEKLVVTAGGFKQMDTKGRKGMTTNELQQLLSDFKTASAEAQSNTISDEDLDDVMNRSDMDGQQAKEKPLEGPGFRVHRTTIGEGLLGNVSS